MQNNFETEECLMKAFAMLKIGEVGWIEKKASHLRRKGCHL